MRLASPRRCPASVQDADRQDAGTAGGGIYTSGGDLPSATTDRTATGKMEGAERQQHAVVAYFQHCMRMFWPVSGMHKHCA